MAKSWVGHNNKVFQKAIAEHRVKLEEKLQKMFDALANDIVDYIEAFGEMGGMPYYTANLADGTGVGVYLNGQLMAYVPTQNATEPQDYGPISDIWGREYLVDALFAAETDYPKGIWCVLFSTVPYAWEIDKFGTENEHCVELTPAGFFSETLKDELLKNFKTAFAREFPNIAKQLTTI